MRTVWLQPLSLGLLLLFAPRLADAQAPMSAPVAPIQVGVAAAVRGTVELTRPEAVGRVVQSGQPVFLGDHIQTDAQGSLQVLLADETVFTIGPNSALTIDEFIYDPNTNMGKVSASIAKGVFRFVTGKIAQKQPTAMQVKLPAGEIGIRGTMVLGQVEGQHSVVMLLGPGAHNNTGDPPGQITVSNTVGQRVESVDIVRPGFGTEIPSLDAPPATPFQMPAAKVEAMMGALATPAAQPSSESGGGSGSRGAVSGAALAGQDQAVAMVASVNLEGAAQLAAVFGTVSAEASQQIADGVNKFFQGVATLDDLRTIETGQFHYAFSEPRFIQTQQSGAPVSIGGLLDAKVNIDFGARTIGGGNSFIRVNTNCCGGNILEQIPFPSNSFSTGSGQAVFGTQVSDITAALSIKKSGSEIAKTADLALIYNDGTNVGAGAIFGEDQTSGLAP